MQNKEALRKVFFPPLLSLASSVGKASNVAVSQDPGGFRKLREVCKIHFHLHPTRWIDYSASFSRNLEGYFWRCVRLFPGVRGRFLEEK